MKRAFAWVAFLGLLLAGCSSPKDDLPDPEDGAQDGDDDPEDPAGSTPPPPPSPPGSPPPNRAPSATLTAASASGTAPLTVDFTIDGSDPDGDALTWSLDADGDGAPDHEGEELPQTVNHTFSAGEYVANLTVSDGELVTTASVAVTVSTATAPEPSPVQVVDGEYVVAAEGCAAPGYEAGETDPGDPVGDDLDEVVRVQFAVDQATIGKPWEATFTFDEGYLYVAVDFFNGDADLLATENTGTTPNFGGVTMDGTVPTGAAKTVLFACAGPTVATVHYEA